MGTRYLITGVQLGILIAQTEQNPNLQQDIDEIVRRQNVGESDNTIFSDVEKVRKVFQWKV